MTSERWPAYVYGEGEEPDYRFSLANERTLLAWLRTTLALLAAGVAVDVVDIGVPDPMTRALAAMLLTLGALCPLLAFARWAMAERAMRQGEPLPSLGVSAAIVTGLVLVAAAALAVVVGTSR
ncbi:DUF202 domain-containing protein [Janibacter hoylei]|uniref:YidH family protein n=1 Tax=Janibacter hoylei TaxID=364298 RepID=UPI002238B33E|nr:DUF202 domain-containing protein [Janibacter hoylei]MCW4601385.1 DUF202 domain-containing protein [Janibacter hoylei]